MRALRKILFLLFFVWLFCFVGHNAYAGNGLEISSEQAILKGQSRQLYIEGYDYVLHNSIEWTSSNPDVISCEKYGLIKGVKKGKATITVKSLTNEDSDSITVYCAETLNEPENPIALSPFVLTTKTPSLFSPKHIFIFQFFKRYTVLGYYDNWFYVSYEKDEQRHEGFAYMSFFASGVASKEIFRQLSAKDIVVFCGESAEEKLTSNYSGKLSWTVASPDVISFDRTDGTIHGKLPGVSAISATDGSKTLYCMVYSVGLWHEPENTYTDKNISIKEFPSSTEKTLATIEEGLAVKALGDISAQHNWLYVACGDTQGFIPISDFPGIDYLLTQFHYYDQGFDERYYEAEAKIYDYSEVLNDIMMDLFNLKINPFVETYFSTADQCKVWTYGSVYTNNLASSCPETEEHHPDSCMDLDFIRDDFFAKRGKGTDAIHKCLWTGHILQPHKTSVTRFVKKMVLYTTANHVYVDTFGNRDGQTVRNNRLYEITHETGHLLGLYDGYCYGVPYGASKCDNEYCYACNKKSVPECVMTRIYNPENQTAYCDDCIKAIQMYLENNF